MGRGAGAKTRAGEMCQIPPSEVEPDASRTAASPPDYGHRKAEPVHSGAHEARATVQGSREKVKAVNAELRRITYELERGELIP